VEAQIRAGHPDLPRRWHALADWYGTQASASQIRNGHRCVTFGPRSFARRRRGVSARAAVTWASQAVIGSRSRKARHGSAGRAWKEGGVRCYLLMR
jgi:hypothetical protein